MPRVGLHGSAGRILRGRAQLARHQVQRQARGFTPRFIFIHLQNCFGRNFTYTEVLLI